MSLRDARVVERGDGRVDLLGVKVWSSGVFKGFGSPEGGDVFGPDELAGMVEAHREIGATVDPRFYAGHPLTPELKLLAKPKGHLSNLRQEGGWLVADIVDVPRSFAEEAIADDARLSPDMKVNHVDPATGKTYPWVVVGLAALGAIQPGNSRLPGLGAQLALPTLNPQTHYAYSAPVRAYYGGDVRSYDVGHPVFPATSPAYAALRAELRRRGLE